MNEYEGKIVNAEIRQNHRCLKFRWSFFRLRLIDLYLDRTACGLKLLAEWSHKLNSFPEGVKSFETSSGATLGLSAGHFTLGLLRVMANVPCVWTNVSSVKFNGVIFMFYCEGLLFMWKYLEMPTTYSFYKSKTPIKNPNS